MATSEEVILHDLTQMIKNDDIRLPTLPEVALRAREVAQSPGASAQDIARIINTDTAMAARILKVANSPLMRGPREVRNITTAIARLGLTCICNLITGLAMEQMFRSQSEMIDRAMRRSWQHATEVAGIAHVICRHFTPGLQPDQAVLAGILHEIGVLPILTYGEEKNTFHDPKVLQSVLDKLHPVIGTRILEEWRFPRELVDVPRYLLAFDRGASGDAPDYADLVMVANLQSRQGTGHPLASLDWSRIPATARLGIPAEGALTDTVGDEFTSMIGSLR
jgi:HD-like signal output (HDOD) protein